MGARAKKPILAALAATSILLCGAAAADDAGERAFANELRILPAFTARLEHTVVVGEETRLEVARLEMAPECAGFRLRYRTLPFEIWRAGTKVVTMPSGTGKPTQDRRESAGKLAALLFMVGSGALPRNMDVALTQRGTHVAYVAVPRDESNPIEREASRRLAEHHGMAAGGDEVLERCVKPSHRYIVGRRLPDKAIAVLGAAGGPEIDARIEREMLAALHRVFPPAFIGRLQVVPYRALGEDSLEEIAALRLRRLADLYRGAHHAPLSFHESVLGWLCERVKASRQGARVLDTLIARSVRPAIASHILARLAEGASPGPLEARRAADGRIEVAPASGA